MTVAFCRHLSYNQISWAVEDANGVFSSLNNLVMLYVASNNIKSVNKNAFKNLTGLTHLDMMDNNITSIQKNAFAEMPSLQVNPHEKPCGFLIVIISFL